MSFSEDLHQNNEDFENVIELSCEVARPKTWVDWILSLPHFKFCVRIDSNFLADKFNYTGLSTIVPKFQEASKLIGGYRVAPVGKANIFNKNQNNNRRDYHPLTISSIKILYGLLHSRFLCSKKGIEKMYEKYNTAVDFPPCPRFRCRGTKCLPMGLFEEYGKDKIYMFCMNCGDIYDFPDDYEEKFSLKELDGSFFGPTWINLFIMRKFPTFRQIGFAKNFEDEK